MLGCIQPMSSPMMKRMLGFCVCCAAAGRLVAIAAASSVNKPSQQVLADILRFIILLLSWTHFGRRDPKPARRQHKNFAHSCYSRPLTLGVARLDQG